MLQNWGQKKPVLAAGASCPMPGCGSLAVTYTLAGGTNRGSQEHDRDCVFICPRCGFEFTTIQDELLFQSVPTSWLLAGVAQA
jgi:hypothetical protein